MVANTDLQIWQDTVKGINEAGKTDLSQEEWSALTVLNGSLSNGIFSSEESQQSYQLLNDSLKRHGNNPVLHTHLYNFVALCYKYATLQPTSTTQATSTKTPTTSENPLTQSKNKQPGTVKNILFGVDGQFKKTLSKNLKFAAIYLFIAAVLAGIIYALSVIPYTNIPAYTTALVVGALASIVLLRKNQNGKIREKFAFLGAAAAGIFMYSIRGEQISGGSAFVWTFLGVGLVLSFIGKNKPKLMVWLAEVIPATLCFLAFERLGGAISGFGAKDIVLGQLASVRYVEAFKIFLLFCLFQSFANNAVATQCRERVRSLWKNLLFYGMQTAVVLLLLCVTLNPLKLSFFDSVKSELFAFSQPVRAGADVFDANGKKLGSATKTPISNALLCEHVPGYLATAYDFHYDGGFDTARITFQYDVGLGVISEKFQPRIYYFNESDGTLEELPNQKIQTDSIGKTWSSVTAITTHFSIYILLNKVEYDATMKEYYNQVIRKPQKKVTINPNFDVIFVIDESNSMENMQNAGGWFNSYTAADNNDPNRIRVQATKQFIDKMSSKDRVGLVGFWEDSRLMLPLTQLTDKNSIKALVDNINGHSPGTALYKGLETAINAFQSNSSDARKIIIALTDGDDQPAVSSAVYNSITKSANDNDITIFTIGLGKTINSTNLANIARKTGGKYYSSIDANMLTNNFEDIKQDDDGYFKDSNGDRISDYYAKLLTEGKLTLSTGSKYLNEKGIDWVNCPADYDGDGLLNGEEIIITEKQINDTLIWVYVRMISDPTEKIKNDKSIRVLVNGKQITFDQQPPIMENDNIFIPLNEVVAELGSWTIDFYDNNKAVFIKMYNLHHYRKLVLENGNKNMVLYENGIAKGISMSAPAKILNSKVLLSVKAIGFAFGLSVKWDEKSNTVIISDSNTNTIVAPKSLDNITSIKYNGKTYPIIAPNHNPVKNGKLETFENADLSVGGWKTIKEISGAKFQGFNWGNLLGIKLEGNDEDTDIPEIGYYGGTATSYTNKFFLVMGIAKQLAASMDYLYLRIILQENGDINRAIVSTGTNLSARADIPSLEMQINSSVNLIAAFKNADAVLRNFNFLPLEKDKKYDLSLRNSYKWNNNTNNPYVFYVDFSNNNKLQLVPKWYSDDYYYLGVIKFNVAVTVSDNVFDLKALHDVVTPQNGTELMDYLYNLCRDNGMEIPGYTPTTQTTPSVQKPADPSYEMPVSPQ